jgi:hypothetical protein
MGKVPVGGKATVYACRLGSCSAPLHALAPALAYLGGTSQ